MKGIIGVSVAFEKKNPTSLVKRLLTVKQQQSSKYFFLNVTNARIWFKRARKPLEVVFPQVFFLQISLYALTMPLNVKLRRFNSMNL